MGRLHWLRQDFGTAFELMEWRWEAKLDANIGTKFKCVSPEWNGEDKAHVLVWNEQGIGINHAQFYT